MEIEFPPDNKVNDIIKRKSYKQMLTETKTEMLLRPWHLRKGTPKDWKQHK
jgi:hypothetical protein